MKADIKGLKTLLGTKTFWAGVGAIAYGIVHNEPDTVISGLLAIFLRDGILKVQNDDIITQIIEMQKNNQNQDSLKR